MSLLLRYFVKGLGWELGKSAAEEAVDELRATGSEQKRLQKEALVTKRAAEKASRVAEKAAKKAAKQRAKDTARRAREVDDELAALKRRVDDER